MVILLHIQCPNSPNILSYSSVQAYESMRSVLPWQQGITLRNIQAEHY